MDGQAMVVKNQFTNQNGPGKSSVRQFIQGYMLRDDAVEPLVVDVNQQAQYLEMLSKLNAPEDSDAVGLLNHKLKYAGIGFDRDNPAISRTEQNELATQCQDAYDRGGTVKQMVISFDTNWLKEHGLLDDDLEEPYLPGDFHGHVDQYRLRSALQDGMKNMFEFTKMKDPQFIGAVQTDTAQVHVHLSVWDNDESVRNDRGMINEGQKQAIRDGFEESLAQQPHLVDETSQLQQVAEVTQRDARFKRTMLERELYQSALQLDQQSLDVYVKNLAMYDQRTLSVVQREHLQTTIKNDWRQVGQRDSQTHQLGDGPKRARRQIRAMKKATQLRNEINDYRKQQLNGGVLEHSKRALTALRYEYKRQLTIVEKYRGFQRPRVNLIYQNRQKQLNREYQSVVQLRNDTLQKLPTKPIRSQSIQKLLKNDAVLANIAQDYDGPVMQSPVYRDLMQSQMDGNSPLDDHTIKIATKHLDDDSEQQDLTVANLTRNQRFDETGLSPQQRLWLAEYEQALEAYEMDAASFGGQSVTTIFKDHKPGELATPTASNSIYERPLMREQSDILSVDAHDIIESGPLRPEIELSIRQQLSRRNRVLKAARQYFNQTKQAKPEWFKRSELDINRQYRMLNKSMQTDVELVQPSYQFKRDGYRLTSPQRFELVQKHLDTVNQLEL